MASTYSDQRTIQQKRYDAQVMERVQKGIALLKDKHGEGWVDKIDLRELNLRDGAACVLGQVYADQANKDEWEDGYDFGVVELGIEDEDEEYGFCTIREPFAELQAAWEDAIRELRA